MGERKFVVKRREWDGENKLGRVATAFLRDLRREGIEVIDDIELDRLLRKAILEKDREARDKVIKQVLPLIVGKCKKYFREEYIVETMDVIQEVMVKILENMEEKFDIERQEEGRCSLFFTWVNYCILWAINTVKAKYLKMPGRVDCKFKELIYTGGDELVCDIDFGKLIEEGWGDGEEVEGMDGLEIYSHQDVEEEYERKVMIERVVMDNFEKAGVSMLLYLGYYDGKLEKRFLSMVEKRLFEWIELNREVIDA